MASIACAKARGFAGWLLRSSAFSQRRNQPYRVQQPLRLVRSQPKEFPAAQADLHRGSSRDVVKPTTANPMDPPAVPERCLNALYRFDFVNGSAMRPKSPTKPPTKRGRINLDRHNSKNEQRKEEDSSNHRGHDDKDTWHPLLSDSNQPPQVQDQGGAQRADDHPAYLRVAVQRCQCSEPAPAVPFATRSFHDSRGRPVSRSTIVMHPSTGQTS